jgi:CheY-like chemotaxis protein
LASAIFHSDQRGLLDELMIDNNIPIVVLVSIGKSVNKNYERDNLFVLRKPVKSSSLTCVLVDALEHTSGTLKSQDPVEKTLRSTDNKKPISILLAEDNLINQKLAIKILEKIGYKADIAFNGLEVVEMVNKKQYDLILMDMQMPEMDGLEATRIIRKTITRQPKIIAMTANIMERDREECFKAGMDAFLSKPFKIDELLSVFDQAVSSTS